MNTLLKSRRFWVGLVGTFMIVLVNVLPAFQPNVELVTSAILAVIGFLVGGFTLEDVNLPEQAKVEKFSK